eukprot:TRINITY_DN4039_c0_g1_i1.p1 TRINITY_DN4039_c0_g1~~TRINITY_DN4039_c0_g1_i1.p1  ORF type:complete len:117 (-),score=21.17 TRINITY_DN4039_c0_g1_i1:399-749(-)
MDHRQTPAQPQPQTQNFRKEELYGGAMECLIPDHWLNVCQIREVPDNQEVFVDVNSELSLIVEILEMEKDIPNDQIAQFHFFELAGENGANETEVQVVKNEPLLIPSLGSSILQLN